MELNHPELFDGHRAVSVTLCQHSRKAILPRSPLSTVPTGAS